MKWLEIEYEAEKEAGISNPSLGVLWRLTGCCTCYVKLRGIFCVPILWGHIALRSTNYYDDVGAKQDS